MEFKFIILLLVLGVVIYFIIMSMKSTDNSKRETEKAHRDIKESLECEIKALRDHITSENAALLSKTKKNNNDLVQEMRKINLINNQTLPYSNAYASMDSDDSDGGDDNYDLTYKKKDDNGDKCIDNENGKVYPTIVNDLSDHEQKQKQKQDHEQKQKPNNTNGTNSEPYLSGTNTGDNGDNDDNGDDDNDDDDNDNNKCSENLEIVVDTLNLMDSDQLAPAGWKLKVDNETVQIPVETDDITLTIDKPTVNDVVMVNSSSNSDSDSISNSNSNSNSNSDSDSNPSISSLSTSSSSNFKKPRKVKKTKKGKKAKKEKKEINVETVKINNDEIEASSSDSENIPEIENESGESRKVDVKMETPDSSYNENDSKLIGVQHDMLLTDDYGCSTNDKLDFDQLKKMENDTDNSSSEEFEKQKQKIDQKIDQKSGGSKKGEKKDLRELITIGSVNKITDDSDNDESMFVSMVASDFTVQTLKRKAKKYMIPLTYVDDDGKRKNLKKNELYEKIQNHLTKNKNQEDK